MAGMKIIEKPGYQYYSQKTKRIRQIKDTTFHIQIFVKIQHLFILKRYTENKKHHKQPKLYKNFTNASIIPFFTRSYFLLEDTERVKIKRESESVKLNYFTFLKGYISYTPYTKKAGNLPGLRYLNPVDY